MVEKFLSDSLLMNKMFVLLDVILLAVDQISAKSIRIAAFLHADNISSLSEESRYPVCTAEVLLG